MKNFRIVSFDLDRDSFILNKRNLDERIEKVVRFIKEENPDISFLQGDRDLLSRLEYNNKELLSNCGVFGSGNVRTISKPNIKCALMHSGDNFEVTVLKNRNYNIGYFNVKKLKKDNLEELKKVYKKFIDSKSLEYIDYQVMTGSFLDTSVEDVEEEFNLTLVSSVAKSYYDKKNKKPMNHLLVSEELVPFCKVKRDIGIVDSMRVSSHYPIIADFTYKKVFK